MTYKGNIVNYYQTLALLKDLTERLTKRPDSIGCISITYTDPDRENIETSYYHCSSIDHKIIANQIDRDKLIAFDMAEKGEK